MQHFGRNVEAKTIREDFGLRRTMTMEILCKPWSELLKLWYKSRLSGSLALVV
jgi:hypothetical protein